MGRFYEGDHVRLGLLRGGIVVRHEGKLRVRFPSSQRLLYLDFMVPDEGPDGRIYPATWEKCEGCGNPTTGHIFCRNCDARSVKAGATVASAEMAREQRAFGVHVASSIRQQGHTVEQRCARCGILLMRYIGEPAMPPLFPEGARVERTYSGDGIANDQAADPTCTPVREAVAI